MGTPVSRGRNGSQGGSDLSVEDFVGLFTLIVGETNRGKTTLTERLLEAYCREQRDPVTVVDLAPSISPTDLERKAFKGWVGGQLHPPPCSAIHYLHDRISPPRLRARDEREAQALAEQNERIIASMFQQALKEGNPALFVNDCSLYLHAGDPHRLLGWIRSAATAVVNGYYGQSLGKGALSHRERRGMEWLMAHCDRLIRL
jgi:hypothetical protein